MPFWAPQHYTTIQPRLRFSVSGLKGGTSISTCGDHCYSQDRNVAQIYQFVEKGLEKGECVLVHSRDGVCMFMAPVIRRLDNARFICDISAFCGTFWNVKAVCHENISIVIRSMWVVLRLTHHVSISTMLFRHCGVFNAEVRLVPRQYDEFHDHCSSGHDDPTVFSAATQGVCETVLSCTIVVNFFCQLRCDE